MPRVFFGESRIRRGPSGAAADRQGSSHRTRRAGSSASGSSAYCRRCLCSRGRAAAAVLRDFDKPAAAAAAFEQTREQCPGPPPVPEPVRPVRFSMRNQTGLPVAVSIPERVVYDPQIRDGPVDPFGDEVDARYALAGRRVLDIAQAVPDDPAGIELVIQDACAALAVSVNVLAPQPRPDGPGTLSRLSRAAIVRGESPLA